MDDERMLTHEEQVTLRIMQNVIDQSKLFNEWNDYEEEIVLKAA